jgi:hypothetical protein
MASITKTEALRLPKHETADRGTVRLGNGCITPELPPLRLPRCETTDRGIVRLGNGCITPELPPLWRPGA